MHKKQAEFELINRDREKGVLTLFMFIKEAGRYGVYRSQQVFLFLFFTT